VTDFQTRGLIDTPEGALAVHLLERVAGARDLPFSHKVILENLLRHLDAETVADRDVRALVGGDVDVHDISFYPARAFLHDTNGIPVLTDLAALRDAAAAAGVDPAVISPVIPAQLTVDHSVVTDHFARPDAPALNMRREYERNAERYRFLKWGQQAFEGLKVVPPGAGIMHQINVEHLTDVVTVRDGWAFPDTVAGTDSHTTMVNGVSVLAWGVGGIEAEAAMLGQPISMLIPPVVGVELVGKLRPGVTATDLVLTLTERMRQVGVVGKIVEFFGKGVGATSIATRCTIANMSPEFGSTAAVFPIDQLTIDFLRLTGRPEAHVQTVEIYARRQGLWHEPGRHLRFAQTVRLNLADVGPSLAGPRRPQDRLDLPDVPRAVRTAVASQVQRPGETAAPSPAGPASEYAEELAHGAVAIASITSCTNTSNPAVMVAAGLLARNAVRRGLTRKPWVKTSLAPGSKVVTDYLRRAGLTESLDELGFGLVGYGCMTCIGNSGDLVPEVARRVREDGLAVASVLSGNRNFDGRINNDVAMNFLASPPLVIAYALAGTMEIDLTTDPLGHDPEGRPVHLADLWPSEQEIEETARTSVEPEMYRKVYATIFDGDERWRQLDAPTGTTFAWDDDSTYLRRPPFLDDVHRAPEPRRFTDIPGARVLEFLGDSVTTDHICPAGRVPSSSAAGRHLAARGVAQRDLNSYASRRGNWEVMQLGGFTNPHLHNWLGADLPRGCTVDFSVGPEPGVGEIHAVADRYAAAGTPLIVLAGKEYGTGSSRDWAAKVTALLGVRAVLAESFERIHRSNLVGMGILPLQFLAGQGAGSLGLDGSEVFDLTGLEGLEVAPDIVEVTATHPRSGSVVRFSARVRIDTPREELYYRSGGMLPYVLRQSLARVDAGRETGSVVGSGVRPDDATGTRAAVLPTEEFS
jgi:aconitate hydratase